MNNESENFNFDFEVEKEEEETERMWVISDSSTSPKKLIFKERLDSFVVKKTKIVEEVITDLIIGKKKDFRERINEGELDSLLEVTFAEKGISTPYIFDVKKIKNKNISGTGKDSVKFANTDYRVKLFPDDIVNRNEFLTVSFPNKTSYLLKSLAVMLGISALFILIIIALFFKTISMLIRQKKITEIKNDLINNITHEFKTPISTISLACEAMREPELSSNKKAMDKYGKMIFDENKRLKKLVENLLNTASIEKGDYDLKIEKVNINTIVDETLNNFKPQIEAKKVRIIKLLNATNSRISGDVFHLTNIISNILDNAIKYANEDPEIVVETMNYNNSIRIIIADNGIGISSKDMDKVFETFYRVPTGNVHNVKGYGIGLSYVKKLVEAHKGKIDISSKPDKGTKVFITFPLRNDE